MTKESKSLRAFASSRETKKEEARPALVPKLRFPEFLNFSISISFPTTGRNRSTAFKLAATAKD